MKKLLTGFLTLSSVALLMLSSCKKSDKMVTDAGSTSSTLTVSTTSPVLSTAMINDTSTVITFTLTNPNYTYKSGGTSNALQVDVVGDNWKNAATTQLSSTSQGFSTFALAKMLLGLSLTAGKQTQVNVRVVNQLSAETALYSNVVTLTVTPINLASWVYVPGDYEGWSNSSSADSLVSATSNGIYTGIINFPAGGTFQFKIVPVKGSWTIAYGSSGTGTVSTSGGNLTVPAAGEYWITVNLNTTANTITEVAADSYSLIGSAAPGTAWTTDTQFKYINDGKENWVLNNVVMTVGEYKFRLDDQWTTSWGPGATAGTAVTSGAAGDGNMQLTTAGNYDFTFYQPPTALGSTPAPLATTTYTAVAQ